jgi:hypothetical protein
VSFPLVNRHYVDYQILIHTRDGVSSKLPRTASLALFELHKTSALMAGFEPSSSLFLLIKKERHLPESHRREVESSELQFVQAAI